MMHEPSTRLDATFRDAVHVKRQRVVIRGATAGLFSHSLLPLMVRRSARPRAVPAANVASELVSIIESASGKAPMHFRIIAASFLIVCALDSTARAQEQITVAAASDLQFAMQDIARQFEEQTGNHVRLSFGSSGNFFAQIQNGAPFDLFFSADRQYPEKLEQGELTEPGTLRDYAMGKLVLWVPSGSKLDLHQGLKALADPSVQRISIANPEHAPYGKAAVAALRHEGLYDTVSRKFVLGENISQAATFVSSGNADAGLLALSLALAPAMKEKGRYIEISPDEYPHLEQAAVVLKSSKNKAVARQFMDFISSPPIVELLRNNGFSVPSGSRDSK